MTATEWSTLRGHTSKYTYYTYLFTKLTVWVSATAIETPSVKPVKIEQITRIVPSAEMKQARKCRSKFWPLYTNHRRILVSMCATGELEVHCDIHARTFDRDAWRHRWHAKDTVLVTKNHLLTSSALVLLHSVWWSYTLDGINCSFASEMSHSGRGDINAGDTEYSPTEWRTLQQCFPIMLINGRSPFNEFRPHVCSTSHCLSMACWSGRTEVGAHQGSAISSIISHRSSQSPTRVRGLRQIATFMEVGRKAYCSVKSALTVAPVLKRLEMQLNPVTLSSTDES
jgi:hypothetical protein